MCLFLSLPHSLPHILSYSVPTSLYHSVFLLPRPPLPSPPLPGLSNPLYLNPFPPSGGVQVMLSSPVGRSSWISPRRDSSSRPRPWLRRRSYDPRDRFVHFTEHDPHIIMYFAAPSIGGSRSILVCKVVHGREGCSIDLWRNRQSGVCAISDRVTLCVVRCRHDKTVISSCFRPSKVI